MRTIIIDKNYEGVIIKENNYYIKNINEKCNILITIRLTVSGSLRVGGWLEVGGSLRVGGSLEVSDWLRVGGSLEVGGSLRVGGSLEVSDWLRVGGSLRVGDWLEVGEYKTIFGLETSICFLIHCYYYIIILENHIKIGCELHSKEEWENFSNKEIIEKDGKEGLEFWIKNKKWILKL